MEAVKMPSTAQVKSQMRTASAEVSKGGDDFKKLLQVKKDQVQPDNAKVKKTAGKDSQKDVEDVSEDKKDDFKDADDEQISSEDTAEQDALLQAAMQQTAVQMAGIVTDVQEQTAEPVKVDDDPGALTEAAPVEAAPIESAPTKERVQQPEAVAEQPAKAIEEPKQPKELKEPKESSASLDDNKAEQNTDNGFKAVAEEKAPESMTEVPSDKGQTEAKPQEKVQTAENTDSHESLYGAAAARTEPEHIFTDGKTETVPLKTSQDTLPQDLGKTLADRFSTTGKELVVELEPANLGKLTIKLVYEAGKAAVSIMASNPKTLEILNQKAAEIASILEEKTGQETIIYTQEAQQESQEENPDGNQGGQGEQQGQGERHQAREDRHRDVESFAQQLRLGLV